MKKSFVWTWITDVNFPSTIICVGYVFTNVITISFLLHWHILQREFDVFMFTIVQPLITHLSVCYKKFQRVNVPQHQFDLHFIDILFLQRVNVFWHLIFTHRSFFFRNNEPNFTAIKVLVVWNFNFMESKQKDTIFWTEW